jgi:hypothetical protein
LQVTVGSPEPIGKYLGGSTFHAEEAAIRGYANDIDWSLPGYVTTYIAVTATAEADAPEMAARRPG